MSNCSTWESFSFGLSCQLCRTRLQVAGLYTTIQGCWRRWLLGRWGLLWWCCFCSVWREWWFWWYDAPASGRSLQDDPGLLTKVTMRKMRIRIIRSYCNQHSDDMWKARSKVAGQGDSLDSWCRIDEDHMFDDVASVQRGRVGTFCIWYLDGVTEITLRLEWSDYTAINIQMRCG